MNKTQLAEQTKVALDKIEAILQAAGIALDLTDYTPHLQTVQSIEGLVQAKKAKDYGEAAKQLKREAKSEVSKSAIAVAAKNIMGVNLPIPEDGKTAEIWDDYAQAKAKDGANVLQEAPFNGVDEAAASLSPEQLKQHGTNLFYENLAKELNSPERIKFLREKYFGKK
jgi:hypothetical protein